MRYYYEKYCFDQDTLTLYFNEQPKALKSNEAKLLAFFIENKNEILSKEQILEKYGVSKAYQSKLYFKILVSYAVYLVVTPLSHSLKRAINGNYPLKFNLLCQVS